MSDIKMISIPMDRFKQLESVYDAAMAAYQFDALKLAMARLRDEPEDALAYGQLIRLADACRWAEEVERG